MRWYFPLFMLVIIAGCRKPDDPGSRYLSFAVKPTVKRALVCVATYDEFCKAYHFPQGQRNRQWVQRIRLVTARKLRNAYTDVALNQPDLRKLWPFKNRSCRIKKTSVIMKFSNKKLSLEIKLDSCRISPSGRVLPSVFKFSVQNAHPKGVN